MWLALVLVILLAPATLLAGAVLLNRVPLFGSPGFTSRLQAYLGHNVAELRPDSDFPELRPAVYPIKPALLCHQVTSALDSLGWEWQALAGDCHYHAIVTTPLLGYKDDVRIGVEPVGDSSSRLAVRSGSRVGRGDMGANIRHVLDLVRAIERQ